MESRARGVRDEKDFSRERSRAALEMGPRKICVARLPHSDYLYAAGLPPCLANWPWRVYACGFYRADGRAIRLVKISAESHAGAVRFADSDIRANPQTGARARRRDWLAGFPCAGAVQGGQFSRDRAYQRVDVGYLPLSGIDFR